jgi:hypothetical protein
MKHGVTPPLPGPFVNEQMEQDENVLQGSSFTDGAAFHVTGMTNKYHAVVCGAQ